ncbi:MAG TPA: M3 family oligoendopeptidase [Gemmatimonadales bacterium]|nr:M3 family oligoendopeptidase [Gemmatimonadales bacterium]
MTPPPDSVTLPADLPERADAFADATWDDLAPRFQSLADAPLDAAGAEAWLGAWSRLAAQVHEAAAAAMIAYTADTADERKRVAHLRFSTEILPKMEEREAGLARRLVALGWSRPDLETTLRRFRTSVEIFREANVPRLAELEGLAAEYQRITGGMLAEWDGERLPLPRLLPHLRSPDRAVRERAFRSIGAPYRGERPALAGLFDRMYHLRQAVAREAGFADFQGYSFRAKHRYDYGPDDCRRFHEAVEAVVVPATRRVLERRRVRLGVDRLRPWDLQVDPSGREPVRAFASAAEFEAGAERVFTAVDPALGAQFGIMRAERLLDLESRPNKAPGGYCETLPVRGRPYVHMNAVGLLEDVMTLLHEAGHCFHTFAAHPLPVLWQRHPGAEAAELASMSMELLALPFVAEPGGFVSSGALSRAWEEHLEDILLTLTHIASVDAFQSWIYTSGEGHDPAARDAAWLAIRGRFETGVDWAGLEPDRVARWYRQLHVFIYPFYYIEYGIAQLGALQVFRNALGDRTEAVAAYRRALALGATAPLPEIYRAAGARLAFDAGTMGELVGLVEERLAALETA